MEKERAIQENEMQNRIELARREEILIAQQGQNARRKASEDAESGRIAIIAEIEAQAARAKAATDEKRLWCEVEAEAVNAVEGARAELDRQKMETYASTPPAVMFALALKEAAGKLTHIDHLNLSPDALGSAVLSLLTNATEGKARVGK